MPSHSRRWPTTGDGRVAGGPTGQAGHSVDRDDTVSVGVRPAPAAWMSAALTVDQLGDPKRGKGTHHRARRACEADPAALATMMAAVCSSSLSLFGPASVSSWL